MIRQSLKPLYKVLPALWCCRCPAPLLIQGAAMGRSIPPFGMLQAVLAAKQSPILFEGVIYHFTIQGYKKCSNYVVWMSAPKIPDRSEHKSLQCRFIPQTQPWDRAPTKMAGLSTHVSQYMLKAQMGAHQIVMSKSNPSFYW